MLTNEFKYCNDSKKLETTKNYHQISRLDFIKKMVLLTGAITAGCSPVKILLNSYPDKYNKVHLQKKIFKSFVTTVIPGAEKSETDLSRILLDDYYPFAKRCAYFTSDLCSRSRNLFNSENFDELSFEQRTKVIQSGLISDTLTKKLYTAAVYMVQVSFYCGIYDDEYGCKLIDFQGSYGFMEDEIYYSNCNSLLAKEITAEGNYS